MANPSPQTIAKNTMAALIREARDAGWARVKAEIRPDGTMTFDAGMIDPAGADDFLSSELRMGK